MTPFLGAGAQKSHIWQRIIDTMILIVFLLEGGMIRGSRPANILQYKLGLGPTSSQ